MNIWFERAASKHKEAIFSWLNEPHMKEFWDNSPEHREDIEIFMEGRHTPSNYFKGMNSYWIGLIKDEPYCLVMTHEENEAADPPEAYKPHLSKKGKTIGLDFGIGNRAFVGKRLAAETLISFMNFFTKNIDPLVDTYIIDPNTNNPRAIHVYQKAGFQIVGEYMQESGYFDQKKSLVMVKRCS